MFDIKIDDISYCYSSECEGECPIVKAEVCVRDEYNHMTQKITWAFDVLSYVNKDFRVGAIELIIEKIVKRIWTELHRPIPKIRTVSIDMYLPIYVDGIEMFQMNEWFDKYLVREHLRDNYSRMLCNSRFGIISHDMRHMYPLPIIPEPDKPRHIMPESYHLDTDVSILDTCEYIQEIAKDRAKAKEKIKEYEKMKIENVIFNDPATIVFWRDGSKTVVKAKDEPYDPEKGLAMAIAKKAYGNEGNYYNEFKKFIKDEPKVKVNSIEDVLEYLEPKEEKNE